MPEVFSKNISLTYKDKVLISKDFEDVDTAVKFYFNVLSMVEEFGIEFKPEFIDFFLVCQWSHTDRFDLSVMMTEKSFKTALLKKYLGLNGK